MSTENMQELICRSQTHTHVADVNGQLSASLPNPYRQSIIYSECWGETNTGSLLVCCYSEVFHNSSPTIRSRFFFKKQKADTTPALHLLLIQLCWPLYLLSFNFLSSTSYLTAAYQSEVRDDCMRRLCLSARLIHGNGKVQTGAVGGQGFLLFSLLDAPFP